MSKLDSKRKQEFYLSFFKIKERKEFKEINGFILFKHWDGNKKDWRVDLFTKESFERMRPNSLTLF